MDSTSLWRALLAKQLQLLCSFTQFLYTILCFNRRCQFTHRRSLWHIKDCFCSLYNCSWACEVISESENLHSSPRIIPTILNAVPKTNPRDLDQICGGCLKYKSGHFIMFCVCIYQILDPLICAISIYIREQYCVSTKSLGVDMRSAVFNFSQVLTSFSQVFFCELSVPKAQDF